MFFKKGFLLFVIMIIANCFIAPIFAQSERAITRYDYIYFNPPKTSIEVCGRYLKTSAKTVYVYSPSRLKNKAHAAMIEANNWGKYSRCYY